MISFAKVTSLVEKRQFGDNSAQSYNVGNRNPFNSDFVLTLVQTSLIVRWAIFVVLVVFVLALLMAYSHARRRMMRGLPPKAYHRVSAAVKTVYTNLISNTYSGWSEISSVQDRNRRYRINSLSIEPNLPSMILRHALHQVGFQLLNIGMNRANL